jgi:hypothetical protein
MVARYPCPAGGRDIVVTLFVTQFDFVLTGPGYATQRTLPVIEAERKKEEKKHQLTHSFMEFYGVEFHGHKLSLDIYLKALSREILH